ncbi:MAG: hypothetical protein ACI30J_09020 [Paludibacteraceae bacterium]
MVTVVFEEVYHHRPLRKFIRLRQLNIKNGTRVYIDSKNEEDFGWYEVSEQHIGIGQGMIRRVTQFFTLSKIY